MTPGDFELLGEPVNTPAFNSNVPDASSGDGILRTAEQCAEWAEEFKCALVYPKDNELFIDIDNDAQFQTFTYQVPSLKKHFGLLTSRITPSKQGLPHRHIVCTLAAPLPLLTRIALQAACGSDPMRELLSIKRAVDGEENVVIFFEPRTGGY